MPGEHALLSASGSTRWMNCPGSVRLEGFFEDVGSPFAEEGTKAHAVSEARLRDILDHQRTWDQEYIVTNVPPELMDEEIPDEMWGFTSKYILYCLELIATMQLEGHIVKAYVEQRLCFNKWVPEGFGTGDFCAVGGNDLHIVDLKYGKGVRVSAEDNSQMRSYALGFLQEMECIYDNLHKVTVHVFQPRINNISSETMMVSDLLDWAAKELKPKADRAYKQTREYTPGRHCKFCKAKAVCKTRAEALLGTISQILKGGKAGGKKYGKR